MKKTDDYNGSTVMIIRNKKDGDTRRNKSVHNNRRPALVLFHQRDSIGDDKYIGMNEFRPKHRLTCISYKGKRSL